MKIIKKISKKGWIILGAIGAVLIAGIVTGVILLTRDTKPTETSKPNKKEQDVEEVVEPKKVQIVNEDSKTRPYAVMINNIAEARIVQSGLPKAYMVYEIVAEGGITRYLALFKDVEVDKIGSVRSARHYYLDYVLENDAIFVHWGWSPQAQSDIGTLGINNINGLTYEGRYFYRDNPFGISTEHTGFTDTEKINKAIDALGYRRETDKGLLLNYSADSVELTGATPANTINLNYSNYTKVKYVYDEETKVYKRFNGSKEQIDYPTGEQITVKNIIAYKVNTYTIAGDTKGRQYLDNVGSGEGYYISEGQAIKINWKKDSRSSKTVYTLEDGSNLAVNDGNTFIQILPNTGSIGVE